MRPDTRHILAFRHSAGEDLGNVRPTLEHRGFTVQTVDLYTGVPMPQLSDAAGLVFMGGPMCANDDLPYLHHELNVIRHAAARRQPILGICLGAQLIAKALGGAVHRNAAHEVGWTDIHLTDAASSDPLFSQLDPVENVFQLHDDTFDLPAGATRLASSPACRNQAFRCGATIYGLQFHPEMTRELIEDWRADLNLPGLVAPPPACARLAKTCEKIVGGWSTLL